MDDHYNETYLNETKKMSKKEKKVFKKCITHEMLKTATRDRLRKKLDERERMGW